MCYLSEWDVYDLFVISSIWGGGAAPSPPTPSSFFKPSQAKPFLGPAPHAVSTTAGSYHWMLSRKPCQHQKKHANPTTNDQTNRNIENINEYQEKTTRTNEKGGNNNEKNMQQPMKNKENHARTHEKQRTTMQKPIKHHEKNKEKPCKNQCKPRRNNENKCIHHTYPTFKYHLYSMSKWYIWYYFSYSENSFMMCIDTLYMLPVRRRTRGTEEIEEMRKQEDEETKRRRNEPYSWSYRGKNMLPVRRRTRGTEEIEEMRKQEDEETKRRRNEPLQLKLSGEKNQRWMETVSTPSASTWISSNIFFLIPHGAEVFRSFPRFATILYVQYFVWCS